LSKESFDIFLEYVSGEKLFFLMISRWVYIIFTWKIWWVQWKFNKIIYKLDFRRIRIFTLK